MVASATDLKDEANTSVVAAVSVIDPDVPEVTTLPPPYNEATKKRMLLACWTSSDQATGIVPVR